jgi:shikimate kinase
MGVERATLWLVGMMGAGKTTVGRLVAERCGVGFVDLDDLIVAAAGRTIPEIFAADGERGFRDLEAEAAASVAGERRVVAAGGGIVTRPEVVDLMRRTGIVIWLDAAPETLAERVGTGAGRPMLSGDPAGRLRELARRREPAYRGAAHHRVGTGCRDPGEVAEEVAGLWTRS